MKLFFFVFLLSVSVGLSSSVFACSMMPLPGQTEQEFKASITKRYRAMEDACIQTGGAWYDQDAYYKKRSANVKLPNDFDSCYDRSNKENMGYTISGCFETRCKCPETQCVDDNGKCEPYLAWKKKNKKVKNG